MCGGLTSKQNSWPRMLLCRGLMNTSSSMLRSRASTALPGLSKDSWEVDSFSLGRPRDLQHKRKMDITNDKQVECLLPEGVAEHDNSFQVSEPPAVDGEAESSNTYEKQAQSQVRGDPQSIPLLRLDSPLLPPSSHLHPAAHGSSSS